MRLVWKSLDKMRCLRKRSTIPFLGFLITFLLFLNLYIEDGYVLVSICGERCCDLCCVGILLYLGVAWLDVPQLLHTRK